MATTNTPTQPISPNETISQWRWIAVILLLVLTGLVFLTVDTVNRTTRIVEQNSINTLKNSAKESARYVEMLFTNSLDSLQTIAHQYEQFLTEPNVDYRLLGPLAERTSFSYIRYINADGIAITDNGVTANVTDRDYFKRGMRGESGMEAVFNSRLATGSVVTMFTPLRFNGEIFGVLTGVVSESGLTSILLHSIAGSGVKSYLSLWDGLTFGTSTPGSLDPQNIFTYFEDNELVSPSDIEGLKNALSTGEDFLFDFRAADGGTDYAYATSSPNDNWLMIQTYPHVITDEMTQKIRSNLLRLEIASFLLLLLFLLSFLMILYKEHRNSAAISELKLQKSSFDLSDTISVLSNRYYKVIKANLKTNTYEVIKVREDERCDFDTLSEWVDSKLREGAIFENDVPLYTEFLNREHLLARFNTGEETLSMRYRRRIGAQMRWVQLQVIKSQEFTPENPVIVIYILDVDDDMRMQKSLEEAFISAKRANESKSVFLSNMSHDIRTPMNAIVGMTAIATSHIDDKERVKDCLKKITVAGDHLLNLINEVLDMSKIESGNVMLNMEEFNFSDLVDNLITITRPMVKAKNHNFTVTLNELDHELVIGDSQRIQQVFMNLLSNAIKYTPERGNIQLTITEKPTDKPSVGCYEIVFEDNGIGMTQEYVEHIFDPFVRAENDDRVRKTQGTGLGMSIVKNIVQMMNGDIKVETELNKGSKFTVTIFLKLPEKHDSGKYADLAGLSVLVVDEDPVSGRRTAALLEKLGMRPQYVLGGTTCIDRLVELKSRGERFPFAILLDWYMARFDGEATIRTIRKLCGQDTPTIIVASDDWSEIEHSARVAGANEFVTMPLFASKLVTVFHHILGTETANAENPLESIENSDFTGKRVLLVEDNPINMEIAVEVLGMAKLTVESCENGLEAVNRIFAVEDGYYDMVLMDVHMPVMDGYEATRAIRAFDREYTKRLPIIAMTANTFSDDIINSKNAGMNEHLGKPIDFNLLVKTLNKYLR